MQGMDVLICTAQKVVIMLCRAYISIILISNRVFAGADKKLDVLTPKKKEKEKRKEHATLLFY